MTNPTEALLALLIVMVILLGVVIIILIKAIDTHARANREHALKLNVIIDNLIEIVTEKYGKEDNSDQ